MESLKQKTRRKRIISLMLSTAMVFSLNTSIWAAEPGEQGYDTLPEEAAVLDAQESGEGADVLDVPESGEEADLSETEEETEEVLQKVVGHTEWCGNHEWECEIASDNGADVRSVNSH